MHSEGHDLCGWQLNNPDQDIFDVEVLEIFGDCSTCEFAGECLIPCESIRRLVPKEGRIVGLGHEKERGEPKMSYFALLKQDEVKFIVLSTPDYFWATANYIADEEVPAWALSQLDSNLSQLDSKEEMPRRRAA